jgi:hypothetical protein
MVRIGSFVTRPKQNRGSKQTAALKCSTAGIFQRLPVAGPRALSTAGCCRRFLSTIAARSARIMQQKALQELSAAGIVRNCVDIPGGARRRHIDRVYAALAPQISAHLKTRVAAVHPAGQGHALQDDHHAHSRTSSTLSIR